jgi:hypothetical protein
MSAVERILQSDISNAAKLVAVCISTKPCNRFELNELLGFNTLQVFHLLRELKYNNIIYQHNTLWYLADWLKDTVPTLAECLTPCCGHVRVLSEVVMRRNYLEEAESHKLKVTKSRVEYKN